MIHPLPGDLIVVLDLHDLVALPEEGFPKDVLRLAEGGGVQSLLEDLVQMFHPQDALFHGGKDLHVHQGLGGPQAAALLLTQGGDPLQYPLGGQYLFEDEIGFVVAQDRHLSLVDPVGIGDDAALGGLAKDLRQADHRKAAAFQAVPQHVSAAHRRQLIGVAHQQQPGPPGQGAQQGVHQRHVYHAHLIHDDQVIDEGIVLVADESLLRVVFEEPMDGACVGAGGLRHALGGSARRRSQGVGHAHARKGVGDAADDGGLARAGAAGDDHHPRIQGLSYGNALAFGQGEMQIPFILGHVPERIGHGRFGKLYQLLGDGPLEAGDIGQEDALLLAHILLHKGAFRQHGVHGVGQQLRIHPKQTAAFDDQFIVRKIGVAVFGTGVLKGVLDAGKEPCRGVGLEARHPLGDGVSGQKTDAVDVVDELVGVLLDLAQGQIPVDLEDAVGLVHRDAVGGQGQQDLPHGFVFIEGVGDHGQLLAPDAGNLQKPLRLLLHDGQGVHAEFVHDEPGHSGADAPDGAAGEIAFDGGQGGGRQGLHMGGYELLSVFGVIFDGPLHLELLSGGGKGHRAADRDGSVPVFGAQREDGVPVLRVPVYDPVDNARYFHIIQRAGSRSR